MSVKSRSRPRGNTPSQAAARRLFTPGAFSEFERLETAAPWSEISRPYFRVQAIRLVSPDTALVDASSSQYGSLALTRRAVLLVMKKEGKVWLIASIRTLAEP